MLSDGGKYQMVSSTDFRNCLCFVLKSTVMLADEHSDYLSNTQVFNVSIGKQTVKGQTWMQ
jgi:hypothetical protein